MAKKVNPAAKRQAPQKQCPKCGKTMHARTSKCECGHVFEAAASKPSGSGKPRGSGLDVEKEAMRYALRAAGGNLDKAIKAVSDYEAGDLAAFIEKCGGKEKALAALQGIKG